VPLEGLGQLKSFIHLTGSRTHDLPVYMIVHQPTTLERVPKKLLIKRKIKGNTVEEEMEKGKEEDERVRSQKVKMIR
jgi:hypothetical protein